MMSLQSSHLTHAWQYTTLCAMLHHLSFLLLNRGWNSAPSRNVFRDVFGFLFLFDCVFHFIPFLPLFQSTTPPHSITTLSLTPPQSTPHHCTHNTPRNHACVLWCLLFACRCFCVSLSARSFLTQPKPRHAIQSPYPPHMAPPMHEPMSEWEGAAVCMQTP